MVTSTSRLLGPHHTMRSPALKPSCCRPPTRRFTSAFTWEKVNTSSPSITAGLSGLFWACTANRSVGAWAMSGNLLTGVPFGFADGPRGVDESDVAEGLGEVAEELTARRVDLLGEQAEVVAEAGGRLECRASAVQLAGQGLRLRQPERAEQERPLFALEAVVGLVAVDESTLVRQVLGDGVDGGLHPGIVGGDEADDRHHEV